MHEESILDVDIFRLSNQVLDRYPEVETFDDFSFYRVLERIGRGGMGEVFLAEDTRTCRRVALKFIRDSWREPDLGRRFQREIVNLAQLEHPSIARLYESGVHPNGTPYFSMEYVEGKPIDQYCDERSYSTAERVRLFQSVCEAVQYAHSRAVVHLDLKPSNILVTTDGEPKLLDFGVAKRLEDLEESVGPTQTQVRFTPAFAAPEQILRQPVGTFTDVYALGVVLYMLLCGRPPIELAEATPGQAEALMKDEHDPLKPSDIAQRMATSKWVWDDIDVLCLKALKKKIDERYHSVVELSQDIERLLRGEALNARPDSFVYKLGKFARRNWRTLAASAGILALISSLTVFYLVRIARARDAVLAQAARTQRIQRFMFDLFGGNADAGPPTGLAVSALLENGVRDAQALGNDPTLQGDLYDTLGGIYQSLGELDRAEALFRLALDRRKLTFGADSQQTAESLIALSALRIDQAKFAEAELLGHQALDMLGHRLPPDHPDVAKALTNLGAVFLHAGKLNEGVKVLEAAVQILSKSPADQADLIEALTQLANCHNHLGQNVAADALFVRILSLDRPMYGDHHPHIAEDLSNLSQSREGLGKFADAERFERESIEIEQNWYGRAHIETALQLEALGKTLIREGRYNEGAAYLREALPIQERNVGKVHPFVELAVQWLGVAALKKGNLDDAESYFQRAAEITHSVYGDGNAHQGAVIACSGEVAAARNDSAKAEVLFRRAIGLLSTPEAPNPALAAKARIDLADVLIREHRYSEAEPELLAGYEVVTSEDRNMPDSAADARRDLAIVYKALNKPAQAERFDTELIGKQSPQTPNRQ
jgi:eukaryotic-like serine/threonine-protein kinase